MYRLLKEYKQLNKGAKNYLKNKDNLLRNGWTLEIDSCYSRLRPLFSRPVKDLK